MLLGQPSALKCAPYLLNIKYWGEGALLLGQPSTLKCAPYLLNILLKTVWISWLETTSTVQPMISSLPFVHGLSYLPSTISHCDNVCVHLTSSIVSTCCTRASPGTSSSCKDWPFYFLKHSGRVLPVSLHPAIHICCKI